MVQNFRLKLFHLRHVTELVLGISVLKYGIKNGEWIC